MRTHTKPLFIDATYDEFVAAIKPLLPERDLEGSEAFNLLSLVNTTRETMSPCSAPECYLPEDQANTYVVTTPVSIHYVETLEEAYSVPGRNAICCVWLRNDGNRYTHHPLRPW